MGVISANHGFKNIDLVDFSTRAGVISADLGAFSTDIGVISTDAGIIITDMSANNTFEAEMGPGKYSKRR